MRWKAFLVCGFALCIVSGESRHLARKRSRPPRSTASGGCRHTLTRPYPLGPYWEAIAARLYER